VAASQWHCGLDDVLDRERRADKYSTVFVDDGAEARRGDLDEVASFGDRLELGGGDLLGVDEN
jgi:hypothetical protein